MWRRRTRPVPGGTKSFVYALVLHVTVLLLLGVSLRFSARTPTVPPVMQAVVMDEAPKRVAEPPDTARLDEQRRKEAEAKAAEAERARQAELKKREDERKQKAEEARRLKEAEHKKELERKKKAEAAEKKKAAALEKKRAEEQRKREAETALQSEVAAEEKRRADARAQGEVERYKGLIRQKVSRHWNKPAGAAKGLQCTVRVRLVPGGEVLAAEVARSSGDAAFDRSVVNAVYKATPLPVPQEPKVFEYFREIEFVFSPES
ncbi:MAG: cell envelope integrity protein TolA [Gammaproteobacteria bacterium]|nr:MAG: cell envelope integrity protein TolA [Gammaproteobacteria bacterium]